MRHGLICFTKKESNMINGKLNALSLTPEQRVEIAVRCALLVYDGDPFQAWASDWIEGKDRTTQSAMAAFEGIPWARVPDRPAAFAARKAAHSAVWLSEYKSDIAVSKLLATESVEHAEIAGADTTSIIDEVAKKNLTKGEALEKRILEMIPNSAFFNYLRWKGKTVNMGLVHKQDAQDIITRYNFHERMVGYLTACRGHLRVHGGKDAGLLSGVEALLDEIKESLDKTP